MVCPLRYIVAGVSIVVAFAVLLWTSSNTDSRKKGPRSTAVVQQRKTALNWFVDLFTGRYLMDRWAEFKASSGSAVTNNSVSTTTVKLLAESN